MRLRRGVIAGVIALAACAHLLPPTWKSFPVKESLARPAVITAMKKLKLPLLEAQPGQKEIATEWVYLSTGPGTIRERYRVWWEIDERERGMLVMYVRHEEQEQEFDGFRRQWGGTTHSQSRENDLMNAIEEALKLLYKAMKAGEGAEE